MSNPGLLKWFNETDAWWFDNVRFSAEQLEPYQTRTRADRGDDGWRYVCRSTNKPATLREPLALSETFAPCSGVCRNPHDNSMRNKSTIRTFAVRRRATAH
jgi:hypothetical protein